MGYVATMMYTILIMVYSRFSTILSLIAIIVHFNFTLSLPGSMDHGVVLREGFTKTV